MSHLLTHMPHFLPKHTAPQVNTAASAAGSNQHHHWRSTVAATASHIPHPHLPPPKPHPWGHDATHDYFEITRMSRLMEHL
jgi:hypothetical protein